MPSSSFTYWDASTGKLLLGQIKSTSGYAEAAATLDYQTQYGLASYLIPAMINATEARAKSINLTQMMRAGGADDKSERLPVGVDSGIVVLTTTGSTPPNEISPLLPTCPTTCTGDTTYSEAVPTPNISFVDREFAQPLCTVPPAPSPQIWFNGENVTNTTQHVVVGQQIALTSEGAQGAQHWSTPSGSAIGGVTALSGSTSSTGFQVIS